MAYEIHQRSSYPYQAIVLLSVTFPNGTRAIGTGAVVQRNDILTATHVLYSAPDGGWASNIELYFGADYNSITGRTEDYGQLQLTNFTYVVTGWPNQVNAAAPYHLLDAGESQYDVALLGVSEPVGDWVGWFGLNSGYDSGVWATQIGYPQGYTGMTQGQAWVERIPGYQAYEAYSYDGSDILGPGSSGGPLFVWEGDTPFIIGVKSAGSDSRSVWADIGFTFDALVEAMEENNHLLPGPAPQPTPAPQPDPEPVPSPPPAPAPQPSPIVDPYTWHYPDVTQLEYVHGGSGLDVVFYNAESWNFQVDRYWGFIEVQPLSHPGTHHYLLDVERLLFSDGVLALDVGIGENAGMAYRLYQAAFNRQPDMGGLGYWIEELDYGLALNELAFNFFVSNEFRELYGVNPSHAELVDRYYFNMLGRAPDPSGRNYWITELDRGYSPVEMLASFSESAENVLRLEPVLEFGIWL